MNGLDPASSYKVLKAEEGMRLARLERRHMRRDIDHEPHAGSDHGRLAPTLARVTLRRGVVVAVTASVLMVDVALAIVGG